MNSNIRGQERKLELLRVENEVAGEEVSLAQKKALIREAKQKYGRDWKKVLGLAKGIRINSEAVQNLHSLGVGDSELRNLSNPFRSQRK